MIGKSALDGAGFSVGNRRVGNVRAGGAVATVSGRSALDGGDIGVGVRRSVTKRAEELVDRLSYRSALHDVSVESGRVVA